MSNKTFRPWDVDQVWLLPPSVEELVPAGHLAHLIRDAAQGGDRRVVCGRRGPTPLAADMGQLIPLVAEIKRNTGRQAKGEEARASGGDTRERPRCGGHRSRYRLRMQTVEPLFGQMKAARGFRQFLLRGAAKARREWDLICTAHDPREPDLKFRND